VPGDQITLVGDRGGRIHSFVSALGRFPNEPRWAVVGGFAANVRITSVHRLTNDLDTAKLQLTRDDQEAGETRDTPPPGTQRIRRPGVELAGLR